MEPESKGPGFHDPELTVVRARSFNRAPASSLLYHFRLHGKLPVAKLIDLADG